MVVDPLGGPDIPTTPERVDGVALITVVAFNDDPLLDDLADLVIDEDSPSGSDQPVGHFVGRNWLSRWRTTGTCVIAAGSDIRICSMIPWSFTRRPIRPDDRVHSESRSLRNRHGHGHRRRRRLDDVANSAGDNLTVIKTFVVTVNPVNDAPAAEDHEFVTLEEAPITITEAELLVGSAGDADPRVGPPQDESAQSTRISALIVDGVTVDASNASQATFNTPFGAVEAVFGVDGFLVEATYTPNENFNTDNPRDGLNGRLDLFDFVVRDDGLTVLPDGISTTVLPPATSIATAGIWSDPATMLRFSGTT